VIAARESRRVVRLLELDPDLAGDLDHEDATRARTELIARAQMLDWKQRRGRWGPSDPRGYLGLLVLEGVLLREVTLARGGTAELLGVGDLLRPWDVDGEEFLPIGSTVEWTILDSVTVAVLDPAFAHRAAQWPEVMSQLISRSVLRAKATTVDKAISHLKHVETRLLLLFWHFALRWGKVGPETISVGLPLTHELLAKFVGATRPSVTTALGQLARRGLLVRDDGVWRLSRESAGVLEELHMSDAAWRAEASA
jgi:CRP/FNR family transcriptional regulator, cyclic AMP receptor protein